MRVAKLYTIDDIRIEHVPVPEPGPGEALIRTRACGICTGDIMGWYMERKAPLVFGHEPAGVVERLGEGVDHCAKATASSSIITRRAGRAAHSPSFRHPA